LAEAQLQVAIRRAAKNGYAPFVLRDGTKKRVIHAPRPWLKAIQRKLLDCVLQPIPVADCVFSARGRDVVKNARQHLHQPYMAVLDVKDCFPSTGHDRVHSALRRIALDEPAALALTRLVTYGGFLPQGPPTSPAILNLVFAPIDNALAQLAGAHDAIYTRYMDDICFSSKMPLAGLCRRAEQILKRYGYRTNPKKRRVWGPEDPHTVTKIVVASTLHPKPDYLHALARELVRAHRMKGLVSKASLRGKIAWIARLDPTLGKALSEQLNRAIT
jgi:hypothetical protein